MEGEAEVGRYVEVLIRRWRLVISVTLACMLIAGLYSELKPKRYRSSVFVAAVKTTTQVSFDTAIKTLSEEELRPMGTGTQRITQRIASFVALVSSPAIAEAVVAEIRDQLPEGLRTAPALLRLVEGRLAEKTDLIEIAVTHADPRVATLVADAWGREYVRQINLIYGDTTGQSMAAIQNELRLSEEAYDREQAALEAALRDARSAELGRRIAWLQSAIQAISRTRDQELQNLLDRAGLVDEQMEAAHDLLAQVQKGGAPAAESSALALRLLKIAAFAGPYRSRAEGGLVLQVEAHGEGMTVSHITGDLEGVIAALGARRLALEQQIQIELAAPSGEPTASVSSSAGGDTIEGLPRLEQLLREMQSELEKEDGDLRQIRNRRDLARQTYEVLMRKEAELALATQTRGADVRVAAPALVATRVGPGLAYNVGIATFVGLSLGVFAALAAEYWRTYRARSAKVEGTAGCA